MGCPAEWLITYLLVHSVQPYPVLQRFSEVAVYRNIWVWSGTCSLQDPINRVGMLEQPTYKKLGCLLPREVEAGVGGVCGFAKELRA